MDPTKTADDIVHGATFQFYPGQRLEQYTDPEGTFVYVHRSNFGAKGALDDTVLMFIGTRRIDESSLPVSSGKTVVRTSKKGFGVQTRKRRVYNNRRRNFMRRKPAFILKGKLVFVEGWDMLFPCPDQGSIYKEEE